MSLPPEDVETVRQTLDRVADAGRHLVDIFGTNQVAMAQMWSMLARLAELSDGHPDPLVVHEDYREPLPGWWVVEVREQLGARLLMRALMTERDDGSNRSDGREQALSLDSWHHPDEAYVREVARQFLARERHTFCPDMNGQPVVMHDAVATATLYRVSAPGDWEVVEHLASAPTDDETDSEDDA